MGSAYLTPSSVELLGMPTATDAQIAQASAIVDSYLQRPEGLVWAPDAAGLPAYMPGLTPTMTFAATVPIAAGAKITIPFPSASALPDLIGDVIVLDRADPAKVEAVAILGSDQQAKTITIGPVAFAHATGATMEFGLVLTEERPLPAKRSVTRVSRSPIARLISGAGRYSYGRRSDQIAGLYSDINLLAAVQTFGGPPQWWAFDVSATSISVATNEVWVPAGQLLAYYSEVRLRYVAGYPAAALPNVIKQATAKIVGKIQEFGDADPSFKVVQAGGTKLERWSDTIIDADTKRLLQPFELRMNF